MDFSAILVPLKPDIYGSSSTRVNKVHVIVLYIVVSDNGGIPRLTLRARWKIENMSNGRRPVT